MQIQSLNVSTPVVYQYGDREVVSAVRKTPATTPVYLSLLNFTGDQQGDPINHGGPDKAICVYAYDHYPYWEGELGQPLPMGAFGENLTVEGLSEETTQIGDTWQIGEAIVQVCQPRIPCYKLAMKFGVADMIERVLACGYTGFYLRVLQEGWVTPGGAITVVDCTPNAPSITFANRVRHHDRADREGARRVIETPALAASWREAMKKRLE